MQVIELNGNAATSSVTMLDSSLITPDYYLEHYMEILPRYISNGRPSEDTMATYKYSIEAFKTWCTDSKIHPLQAQDYHIRIYIQSQVNLGMSDNTIAIKLAAIKAFYFAAKMINLITVNPCDYIKTNHPMSMSL